MTGGALGVGTGSVLSGGEIGVSGLVSSAEGLAVSALSGTVVCDTTVICSL
ncbi:MAG: hypothetical protein PHU79_00070 [Oscillospiraceae bacterium]|nr:hypothetical protein [Oscillospiraceae bacterium]